MPHSCVFTYCTILSQPCKSIYIWELCSSPSSKLFKLLLHTTLVVIDRCTNSLTDTNAMQVAKANSSFILHGISPRNIFPLFHSTFPYAMQKADIMRKSKSHSSLKACHGVTRNMRQDSKPGSLLSRLFATFFSN